MPEVLKPLWLGKNTLSDKKMFAAIPLHAIVDWVLRLVIPRQHPFNGCWKPDHLEKRCVVRAWYGWTSLS